jgi:Ca2+-binding EF-hand superfamily protein
LVRFAADQPHIEENPTMTDTSEYETTFALIDIDGDGLITAPELQKLMEALGAQVSDEAAAHAVEVLDTNGDGLVSLEELASYLSDPGTGPAQG